MVRLGHSLLGPSIYATKSDGQLSSQSASSPTAMFKWNTKAVSPAISTVIITAATIVLVLVASNYAYQTLERNEGLAEFGVAKKAMLAFDDAVKSIAWKTNSSRSVRFVASYGALELLPNALNVTVLVQVGADCRFFTFQTGLIRYYTSVNYVTYGGNYKEYILGDEKPVVSSTQSAGQIAIEQQSRWVNVTLEYRVCAMKTFEGEVRGENLTYIDIYIIKIDVSRRSSLTGELDLKARCVNVATPLSVQFSAQQENTQAIVFASFGGGPQRSWSTAVKKGIVVFNFIVSTVSVGV